MMPAMTRDVSKSANPARTKCRVARYLCRQPSRQNLITSIADASRRLRRKIPIASKTFRGHIMVITAAHITPIVALLAGILILIIPRLLNYIVAIYLIFVGIVGLNNVHHFFNWH